MLVKWAPVFWAAHCDVETPRLETVRRFFLARARPSIMISPFEASCGEIFTYSVTDSQTESEDINPQGPKMQTRGAAKTSSSLPRRVFSAPCQCILPTALGWHPMRKLANYQFTTWRISVHVTTVVLGDPRRTVLKNDGES